MQDVSEAEDLENEQIFTKEQQEILDLYDQVQKLELELALTKARVRLASKRPFFSPRFYTTLFHMPTTHRLAQTKAPAKQPQTRAQRRKKTRKRPARRGPSSWTPWPCTTSATPSSPAS